MVKINEMRHGMETVGRGDCFPFSLIRLYLKSLGPPWYPYPLDTTEGRGALPLDGLPRGHVDGLCKNEGAGLDRPFSDPIGLLL